MSGDIATKRKKLTQKEKYISSRSGKRTMRAYLWKVCGEEYDQTHQG